ncbi:extracellular solute-binding protein [Ruania rhizosphaerae]|uniref:extracellular solute-binding protein n=1 Tax=Ruania rhizosphaerae TaxID=1840413 RepID=UPI00135B4C82|nr:extracellular solute-binding protein [Ruania rhizosphaerae]
MISSNISRRSLLGVGLTAAGATAFGLTACGSSSGNGGPSGNGSAAGPATVPTYRAQPLADAEAINSSIPGIRPVYTTRPAEYWQSVEQPPGSGESVTTLQMLWFAPPDALPENPVWQELNERLNVDFQPGYASGENYQQKIATTLASGDLPDIMFLQDGEPAVQQAITDGAFADLSEVLGGDGVLDYPNLANIPTHSWKNSMKQGRILGVPRTDPTITKATVMRRDIADAIGLSGQPADAAELREAFSEVTAYAEAEGLDLWPVAGLGTYEIELAARWMFRVGTDWQLDGSGKLVNFVETDAYAAAIEWLAGVWSDGSFHPDGLALGTGAQRNNAKQLFMDGKTFFEADDASWLATQGMNQAELTVQGAQCEFLLVPGHDGGEIVVPAGNGYWGICGFPASVSDDPDRLRELLGVLDFWAAPFGTKEKLLLSMGVEGYNWERGADGEIVPIDDAAAQTNRQGLTWLGVQGPSVITLDEDNGHRAEGLMAQMEHVTSAAVDSPVLGLTPPSGASMGARLTQIHEDWRNQIVSGRSPLDALEDWRQEWRNAGGDQIRTELEELLAAND